MATRRSKSNPSRQPRRKRPTRIDAVLKLLRRNNGASIAELQKMDLASLQQTWRRCYQMPPPRRRSRDLLIRGIAYRKPAPNELFVLDFCAQGSGTVVRSRNGTDPALRPPGPGS